MSALRRDRDQKAELLCHQVQAGKSANYSNQPRMCSGVIYFENACATNLCKISDQIILSMDFEVACVNIGSEKFQAEPRITETGKVAFQYQS